MRKYRFEFIDGSVCYERFSCKEMLKCFLTEAKDNVPVSYYKPVRDYKSEIGFI